MSDHRARVLACRIFSHYLAIFFLLDSLSVGVYKYARPVSLSDCIFVLKVARSVSYESQGAIEAIAAADQQVPIFLSRQETADYVASVRS